MRPDRFTAFLHAAIVSAGAGEPAVESVTTFADEGVTDPPYGTAMTFKSGARVYW